VNVHGGWKVGAADETLPPRVRLKGGRDRDNFPVGSFRCITFNRSAGPRVPEKTDDLANLISFFRKSEYV
jgi:hypothetical protein